MNLFQLVLKQMRQRALSTWLTMLSVLLGVALAVAILILQREGAGLFGQKDYGFDVLVGPKGSPTQLVLNTVYHIDRSPGNIPYSIYENILANRQLVRTAIPYGVGDTYMNHRVVATLPKIFGAGDDAQSIEPEKAMEYRLDHRLAIAQGRSFKSDKFEAVIGADITDRTKLKLGDSFQITHGMPQPNQSPDVHAEQWKVVGVMARTNTALDRVIMIPLMSFWAIGAHEDALHAQAAIREGKPIPQNAGRSQPTDEHDEHDHAGHHHEHESSSYNVLDDGTIELKIPKSEWALSAVLVRTRGAFQAQTLIYTIKNGPFADAVNPASVMREFFQVFFAPSAKVLMAVASLVIVVAAVGILVSIYNSVSARRREVAILRALGATRARILTMNCLEAGLIGLFGGILGLVAGHLLAGVGSVFLARTMGEGIAWHRVGYVEAIYLSAVVLIAVLAGLAPALKAYRTPVATNLVAA
jgi:putative ABC transport system permease protein